MRLFDENEVTEAGLLVEGIWQYVHTGETWWCQKMGDGKSDEGHKVSRLGWSWGKQNEDRIITGQLGAKWSQSCFCEWWASWPLGANTLVFLLYQIQVVLYCTAHLLPV
jgi:hypothetical protein